MLIHFIWTLLFFLCLHVPNSQLFSNHSIIFSIEFKIYQESFPSEQKGQRNLNCSRTCSNLKGKPDTVKNHEECASRVLPWNCCWRFWCWIRPHWHLSGPPHQIWSTGERHRGQGQCEAPAPPRQACSQALAQCCSPLSSTPGKHPQRPKPWKVEAWWQNKHWLHPPSSHR